MSQILDHIPSCVTTEDNTLINHIPGEEEIKQTVWKLKLISQEQGAFQVGKNITEHVLITKEMVHLLAANVRGGNCIIKLDLSKAFDNLSWAYLEGVLAKFGFDGKATTLLLGNLRATFFSVLVNGQPKGFFPMKCGVKQGDPLSPLLFIIALEGLARYLNFNHSIGLIKSFSAGRTPTPCHLLYADDIIIFTTAECRNLLRIKGFLSVFMKALGQEINYSKSRAIVHDKMRLEHKLKITKIMAIKCSCKEFKYLGSTIVKGKLRRIHCKDLVERFEKKLNAWYSKKLNQMGRLILIKHVLSSIPLHLLAAQHLPKSIIKNLNRQMANFFWGAREDGHKYHWRSWNRLCYPFEEGGMGLRNLTHCQDASFIHLWWKIVQGSSLWSRYMRKKYFRNRVFSPKLYDSYTWKAICRVTPIVLPHCNLHANGVEWLLGSYSFKTAFYLTFEHMPKQTFCIYTWDKRQLEKISMFLWRLLNNLLPLPNNLQRMHVTAPAQCPPCMEDVGDEQHIFLNCRVVSPAWRSYSMVLDAPAVRGNPTVQQALLGWWFSSNKSSIKGNLRFLLPGFICWSIWKIYNSCLNDHAKPSTEVIIIIENKLAQAWCWENKMDTTFLKFKKFFKKADSVRRPSKGKPQSACPYPKVEKYGERERNEKKKKAMVAAESDESSSSSLDEEALVCMERRYEKSNHEDWWTMSEDDTLCLMAKDDAEQEAENESLSEKVKSLNKELGILKSKEAVDKLLETTKHKGREGLSFDPSSSKKKGKTTFIPPKPTAKPNKQKGKEKENPQMFPKSSSSDEEALVCMERRAEKSNHEDWWTMSKDDTLCLMAKDDVDQEVTSQTSCSSSYESILTSESLFDMFKKMMKDFEEINLKHSSLTEEKKILSEENLKLTEGRKSQLDEITQLKTENKSVSEKVKSLDKELGILKSKEAVDKLLEATKQKGREGLGFDPSSSKRKEAAKYPGVWYLDTGCSRHMTGDASLLNNLIPYDGPRVIFGGSNDFGLTKGLGNLVYKGLIIQAVSYVEGLNYNLLSISQFCDKGYSLEFCKDMASLKNISTSEVILTGKRIRNIYEVMWDDVKEACLISKADTNLLWLWHKRLSHLNFKTLSKLSKEGLVEGLPNAVFRKESIYKDEEINEGDRMKPTEFIPFKSLPLKTSQRNPDSDGAEPTGNHGQPSIIPDHSNGDNSGNGDPVSIHPESPTNSVFQPEAQPDQPVNRNQHNLRWLRDHHPQQVIGDIQSGIRTRSAQQNLEAMLAYSFTQNSTKMKVGGANVHFKKLEAKCSSPTFYQTYLEMIDAQELSEFLHLETRFKYEEEVLEFYRNGEIKTVKSKENPERSIQLIKSTVGGMKVKISLKRMQKKLHLPNSGIEIGKLSSKNLDWKTIGISWQIPSGSAKKADLKNDYKLVMELVIACLECGSGGHADDITQERAFIINALISRTKVNWAKHFFNSISKHLGKLKQKYLCQGLYLGYILESMGVASEGKKYDSRYWLYYVSSKGENRASSTAEDEASSDNVLIVSLKKSSKRKLVVSPSPSAEAPQNLALVNF
ncbi:unnamed protein product [Cuscuta campestris]|uniref:Reverse transcriptase domain-containing protein n=1 Tax=Cuscuta campestris TaxID=132261 RepID=A0A484M7K1_9ASTE|nr:unnamed protein product [Cuscuta campestris]